MLLAGARRLHGLSCAMATPMSQYAQHECRVSKKPSPHISKAWTSVRSKLQRRWLVTRGVFVDYYAYPKPARNAKPKGSFDLRKVERLRSARECDPTAPEWAVEVHVDRHRIVLDFEDAEAHHACLRIWTEAVPSNAMPREWQPNTADAPSELRQEMARLRRDTASQEARHEDEGDDDDDAPPGTGTGAGASAAAPAPSGLARVQQRDSGSELGASAGARRKVMVLGSTGNVGQATLHWMVQKHADTCEVRAGTRDPRRLDSLPGVIAVMANLNEPEESWLRDLDGEGARGHSPPPPPPPPPAPPPLAPPPCVPFALHPPHCIWVGPGWAGGSCILPPSSLLPARPLAPVPPSPFV